MYDVTNRETFEHVEKWLGEARANGNPEMTLCLVANKCDLEDKRVVSTEEGESLAKSSGMLYIETSAKSATGIHEVFIKLAEAIVKKLKKGTIDPSIDEFGVKHVSGPPFLSGRKAAQSPQSQKPRVNESEKQP